MSNPTERIKRFVDARTGMQGLDPDIVHGVNTKGEHEFLLLSDLRSLLADLERAEKDAERYRFLRAEHERHDPVCHLSWKQNSDRDGSEWVNTANLDAAIEAALSQIAGGGEKA